MAAIQTLTPKTENASTGSRTAVLTQSVQFIHEINSLNTDSLQIQELAIKPSVDTTVIRLYSTVDTSRARKGESDVYLASVRRKKCRELSSAFLGIKGQSPQELLLETQPILNEINSLIQSLQRCSKEADTREILRQIRDTIRNGQWEHFKSEACRKAASDALRNLSNAIVADMQMVVAVAEKLENNGFVISGVTPQDE